MVLGYRFHLTFLMLNSVELAILRVKERVKMGGHFVPEETIRRRYEAGLKNFFELYLPIADSWQMYDNSITGQLTSIASSLETQSTIDNPKIWNVLMEKYNGSHTNKVKIELQKC